jgi:monothiol glutaredoxin
METAMTTNPKTTEEKILEQIKANPVLLYMKGTPANPQCGFSRNAVAALNSTGIDFAYINVLENPFIREKLPKISQWPTYPQLFVAGELVGGADIVEEMGKQGTLKPLLEKATLPAEA